MPKTSTPNENLIQKTTNLWRLRLGRDLSGEEARQIVENVSQFFALLTKWSQQERIVYEFSENEPSSKSTAAANVVRD